MARKPAAPPSSQPRMRGFEPAFSLMTRQLRHAGEARGFAVSRLITHWAETVGEDLARVTRPVKIGWAREGMGATLSLLVNGAHAPMISMQLERIRERVNAVYGYNAISRISLTQTASDGFAEGQAQFSGPAAPAPPDPVAEAELAAEARSKAEGVSDPGLRNALEQLARNILTRPDRK
ncbi:DUF721 domain-containing protein [Pseudogemmobacter faecipullorum]|uniref:DUF721 domain-containing protein n=1 Tax=Pseudogemmobacter faecipullorum TaxID=2755041 RepID=A0ABS8CJP4_9RHOB|nr:DUF721 domain-containing protein [Pseudogemmobacter faecipullorum]MCB5409611.1 DUF721 domain-containing protein [Pseudogemmobacter faecipullorum]